MDMCQVGNDPKLLLVDTKLQALAELLVDLLVDTHERKRETIPSM